MADVFEKLSRDKLLAGHEVKERFYEIGSVNGLDETVNFFKNEELKIGLVILSLRRTF